MKSKRGKASFLSDVTNVFSSRIMILVIKFAAGAVLARFMGANGRGLLAAITVVPTLIAQLSDMGVRQAAAHTIARKRATTEEVTSAILVLFAVSALIGVTASVAYSKFFGLPSFTNDLIALTTLAVPLTIFISYCSGIFLGHQQIAQFSRMGWIPETIRFVIIGCLALLALLTVRTALIAQLTASSLMACYAFFLVRRLTTFRWHVDGKLIKSLLTLSSTFALSLFMVNLNYRLNTVVMQHVSTLREIGFFAVALSLVELVLQIPTALSAIVFSRSAGARDDQAFTLKVVALMRWTTIAAACAGAGLCVVSPILVPLAYGKEFASSVPAIFVLMPGVVSIAAFRLLTIDMNGKGRPGLTMWASIPALGLNTALSTLLCPEWGALGAAAASSISYIAMTWIYMLLYMRVTKLRASDILLMQKGDFTMLVSYIPPLKKLLKRMGRY